MRSQRQISRWSVVVAMPAHNEEGLAEFVAEIDEALAPLVARLSFVVVDDASSTPVNVHLAQRNRTFILTNDTNLGHGPSVLRAYQMAVELAPDAVIHVDGDGQFLGTDFAKILEALEAQDGVLGVRVGRDDPWFRSVISWGLTRLLPTGESQQVDVNTPLRAYRTDVVQDLLDRVDPASLVPHVRWTLLHRTLGLSIQGVPVTSRPRRGESVVGTTWGKGGMPGLPSRRLIAFVVRALLELCLTRRTAVPRATAVAVLDDTAA